MSDERYDRRLVVTVLVCVAAAIVVIVVLTKQNASTDYARPV